LNAEQEFIKYGESVKAEIAKKGDVIESLKNQHKELLKKENPQFGDSCS
jgi:hypothetical protein